MNGNFNVTPINKDAVDNTPQAGSANPVSSGGVYTALQGKVDKTVDGTSNNFAIIENDGDQILLEASEIRTGETPPPIKVLQITKTNVTIDGNEVVTDASLPTIEASIEYVQYNKYTSFSTTSDYVGYYVSYNDEYTLVTNANKDSVGITAGTTVAYMQGNAVTIASYNSTIRKYTLEKGENFVKTNDVDDSLSSSSTNPVQNKVIAELVPAQASSSNQLADKSFVNSSISTNTANFIGTFANVPALLAYAGTVTNNDYAFVVNSVITDNGNDWASTTALNAYDKDLVTDYDYAWVINGSNFDLYRFDILTQTWGLRVANTQKSAVTLNTQYNRYKYIASTSEWDWEFPLNNSSFTASQWASINSGITDTAVAQIGTNTSNIALKENASNKVTSISNASTDAQYPSAKSVYDYIENTKGTIQLVGTQDHPINFYNDLEIGKLYALKGYVTLSATVTYNLGHFVMIYRDTNTSLLSLNGWFDNSSWRSVDGGSGGFSINDRGYIQNLKRYVPVDQFNGSNSISSTSLPSFYAPTSAGTSGYILQSNGTGSAPTFALQKTTSISSSSTNTQIPTSKSVYNYCQEVSYLTTAPSSANTSGRLKIVVLTSEPATKYDGYIYFITEA